MMDLILGTAQFAKGYGVTTGDLRSDGPEDLLRCAASAGFTAVDTAPAYGDSEEQIGLSGGSFKVHTKIEHGRSPGGSLERSLQRLRRRNVEVLYFHDSAAALNPDQSCLDAAFGLVGSSVGSLGVSIYDRMEFEAAVLDPRISVVQAPLNLASSTIPGSLLEAAANHGVGVVARSVLLQGVLLADPAELSSSVVHLAPFVARFRDLCRRWGYSELEVCLGWVGTLPGVTGLIVGAVSCEQLVSIGRGLASSPLPSGLVEEVHAMERPSPADVDPRLWIHGDRP